MTNFVFHNSTKVYFGKDAIRHLPGAVAEFGDNVLLVYGGGSIKKNGVYSDVISVLEQAGKQVTELSGVMANPRTEKVYEGIALCRKHNIAFILAVGGGSVIDCAKAVAAGACLEEDFWQALYMEKKPLSAALPVGAVLTIAATGSEMNNIGVITNWEQNLKIGYGHPLLQPQFAVMDPAYTYSLPREQLVYGSVDILSHVFEVYFSPPDKSNLSDDLAEAVMKNTIENLNAALEEPTNYTARANLMWCSTLAINGLLRLSKKTDFQSHQIEHALSAFYDIAHGAGLAVVHPNYLQYTCRYAPAKFARYARNIWGIDPAGKTEEQQALEGIDKTRAYFREIGAPVTLEDVGIPVESIEEIAATVKPGGGAYHKLTFEDIRDILRMCAK